MKKYILHWTVFLLILAISYNSMDLSFSLNSDNAYNEEAMLTLKDTSLLDKIKEKAVEYKKEPINAKKDPVWKAIPGYNGIEVDINASYKKMKENDTFEEKNLVFRQIEPEVQLSDLPPLPIYKGNPEKPMVTFLVNVAWGNEYLPKLIEVFKKNKVNTTFFLDGSWVKKYPDLAKMIKEEGHEIGNHAYTHPDLATMTSARVREELRKTNDVIKATLDVTPKYFAPPSGSFREEVVTIASEMDMYTILWSVDTIDWRNPEPSAMADRVISKVHPGAMILMHPTEASANGLDMMIKGIKKQGYEIGPVSELLNSKRLVNRTEQLKSNSR